MTIRVCSHDSPFNVVICPDCGLPYEACQSCGLGVCIFCAESMVRRKARQDRDQRRRADKKRKRGAAENT